MGYKRFAFVTPPFGEAQRASLHILDKHFPTIVHSFDDKVKKEYWNLQLCSKGI